MAQERKGQAGKFDSRGAVRHLGESGMPLEQAERVVSTVVHAINDNLATTEDIGRIESDVDVLKTDVKELKVDAECLKTDVGGIRSDMRDMETRTIAKLANTDFPFANFQTDVTEFRADIAERRADIAELRADMAEFKTFVIAQLRYNLKWYIGGQIVSSALIVAILKLFP